MKTNQLELLQKNLSFHEGRLALYLQSAKTDTDFEIKVEQEEEIIEDIEGQIEFLTDTR